MSNINGYEMKMLEAFVQNEKSLSFYANAYNVMKSGDSLNLKFFWSWWAFFGNPVFLLYRKLYIPFAISLVIMILLIPIDPFGRLLVWIILGSISPYLVLKSFVKKKQQIEFNLEDENQRIEAMKNIGGVNRWALALVLIPLLSLLILGTLSMKRALPEAKEERIYKAIKIYSPYVLEKRVGGLEIVDKRNGQKEKPSAAEVYHRQDELDKKWAKEYLKIEGNELIIIDENNQLIGKIDIQNEKERKFLKDFYGI